MRVLDATFLIDYGNEVDAAAEYLFDHADHEFLVPAPVYTEYLLGSVHSNAPTDIEGARGELVWSEVFAIDEETAVTAARVADETGPEGPNLTAIDALVAGVSREVGAPLVSDDSDLTHAETKDVVDVDEYR